MSWRIILISLLAFASSTGAVQADRVAPPANSNFLATICAKVLAVGHSIRKPDEKPNLYPFFVKIRVLKKMRGGSDALLQPGYVSDFGIHSPSRLFSVPEAEITGKNFVVILVKNPEGWQLTSAREEAIQCGEQSQIERNG